MSGLSVNDVTGIGSVANLISGAIDRIWPDPTVSMQIKVQLQQMQQAGEFKELDQQLALIKTQTDTNTAEAQSGSVWASGWRPLVGYICGFALAYASIIEPIARFVAKVLCHYAGGFPDIDTSITLQVLLGMLGLGGLRSYDKSVQVQATLKKGQ